MLAPTSRLLTLLELLQAAPAITGSEIAERLEIDPRTVRRYVQALQDLGIPVEGQRGVGGGYRIRPGYRLPPLMLSDDEAVVVVLGLMAARQHGLDTPSDSVDGALTKIHRVLPDTLRRQVEALEQTLGFTARATEGAPVPGDAVLMLADAIRRGRRMRAGYRTHEGVASRRLVSPFGLVVHNGRWYLAGHDHTRDALRTFRVDRLRRIAVLDERAVAAPAGFDAVAHVSGALARVPWEWEAEVLLALPIETVRERLGATMAELDQRDDQTLLRIRVGSLAWLARMLAGLDCGFTVLRPDELRESVRELAGRLASAAR